MYLPFVFSHLDHQIRIEKHVLSKYRQNAILDRSYARRNEYFLGATMYALHKLSVWREECNTRFYQKLFGPDPYPGTMIGPFPSGQGLPHFQYKLAWVHTPNRDEKVPVFYFTMPGYYTTKKAEYVLHDALPYPTRSSHSRCQYYNDSGEDYCVGYYSSRSIKNLFYSQLARRSQYIWAKLKDGKLTVFIRATGGCTYEERMHYTAYKPVPLYE